MAALAIAVAAMVAVDLEAFLEVLSAGLRALGQSFAEVVVLG